MPVLLIKINEISPDKCILSRSICISHGVYGLLNTNGVAARFVRVIESYPSKKICYFSNRHRMDTFML